MASPHRDTQSETVAAKIEPETSGGSKPGLCVIGIGASAGGLEALRTLFSRLPASPDIAYVVVVHLSPEHESHLVEMLQPYTRMPVCQVVKTTALEPNHVYVIPPNANLDSIDTHLRLTELEVRRGRRAPIDHFLRTLAATHGESAIGVILSGAGSDGALGIRQIKEHGGLTIVQDPREAEYSSMPQSALATGTVDLVLPVRDMPEEITGYCRTQRQLATLGRDDELAADDAAILEMILGEVRQRTGQEFAMYRRAMLLRRLSRRMRLHHVSSLAAYFEVLRTHPEEARALHDDLLLNVTEFFRDAKTYETIERVLREILARKDDRDTRVRIWSIGCSTGEEAYSLAILLFEQTAARGVDPVLQVFASELSSEALQQAREGVYPQEIAASVSQDRLERFFVYENGCYHVRRELRDVVTFASHDLFKDPPYAHLDLIVCRSLLHDLQPAMRRGVLSLFYYALEPHGMLLIDPPVETESSNLFTPESATPGLLLRSSGHGRVLQLPPGLRPFARLTGERGGAGVAERSSDAPTIFHSAIARYSPPSVLIDPDNRVVHFSTNAARYVRIPGGELTLDILELVPASIRRRLEGGLQVVRREQRSWQSEKFGVLTENGARRLTLRVDLADGSGRPAPQLLLVVFDDQATEAPEPAEATEATGQVRKLQTELEGVRMQLDELSGSARFGSLQTQHDAELREMVVELECVREELQAANEELLSVNQENRFRIETLAELSNDLQHLFESTGFAMVLLDTALRVVRFTPLARALLRLKDIDVGRPITDMNHHLRYARLGDDLQRVVEEQWDLEVEAQTDDGRWFLVRAQPYRTARHGVEGVSLLFVDTTARKRAELELGDSNRHKEEFLAVLAHELRNPLAPIATGIELLRKNPQDQAAVQRVTATMARQAKQLVRLVDDLVEVVRINEGKLNLRMQAVAITDVVRDAVANVRPTMDSLQHHLTIDAPEESLIVEGDGTRLTQVIGNLLHNASRYTPPHGEIALRVRRDDGHVVIAVQDNGQGIPRESLGSVFDLFYQGGGAGVNNTGLGIGLTLAKSLVELHRGTIGVESAGTDRGSTFIVRLPLSSGEIRAESTADTGPRAAKAMRRRRVLIVDDNADAAETLGLLVKTLCGGEVHTASNGPAALETAAKLQPDVVLLDLAMPGMDGYAVARRMRAESWGKHALLIALSGWGQDRHRRHAREAGFDSHMTKPADVEALRAVLNGS